MKWLNDYRMRFVLVGFVAAMVLGGGSVKADFTLGEPINLGSNINGPADDWGPSISPDGLSLFFGSGRTGGYGNMDIYMTTRLSTDDDWGVPVNLGPTVNSSSRDLEPDISADGLELYFESRRPGGSGLADIWVTKRATKDDDWGAPVNLGPLINTSDGDGEPSISLDGLELYFVTDSGGFGGDSDLFVSTRENSSTDWGIPVILAQVNPPGGEWCPNISADGRVLVFGVSQSYTSQGDIWMAIRNTVSGDWKPPVKLKSPINSSSDELSADISGDGRTLYFESSRPGGFGGYDIWQAPIIPIVDFNGDGIVDSADMCIMVDNWGTDNPLCDIGPMPWGDGIVDVEDLKVLAEHLFEEFPPVEPIQ